jgi:hypothetical protein
MVADVAAPHAKGMLAEFRVGAFHLALEKILADHPGTANFYGVPQAEYTHSSTFSVFFQACLIFSAAVTAFTGGIYPPG